MKLRKLIHIIPYIVFGLCLIEIGMNILTTGGYLYHFGYFSEYGNLKLPVGVVLVLFGIFFIFYGCKDIFKKHR